MFDWVRDRFSRRDNDVVQENASHGLQLVFFLASQISTPDKAVSVQEKVEQFQQLSPVEQYDALPATYLLLEQYLAEVDPLKKYTREQLRDIVRLQYTDLLTSDPFALIFIEDKVRQELLLCRDFISAFLHRAYQMIGSRLDEPIIWLANIPDHPSLPVPLQEVTDLPQVDTDWIPFLRRFSQEYFLYLEEALGPSTAVQLLENGYEGLAQMYMGLETFPIIIRLLPEKLLDEQKISLLSSRQIQRTLIKNVADLEKINETVIQKNAELEHTQSALITAREEALRSSAQFQAVINTVGDGIVAFTHLGEIVLVNKEAQMMWDTPENELVGDHILTLLPDLYLSNWEETINANGLPLKSGFDVTMILGQWLQMESQRRRGQLFPLEVKINVTQIGERMLYTVAVRDITERKRFELAMAHARDWALEASDLKSRLLANVGHDLRTPLNAMIGYTDMLIEGVYGKVSVEQLGIMDRILRNGAQMNGLINNLLDQVRSESGQVVLKIRPFHPATLLENIQSTTELAARKKGLTCTTHLDPQLPDCLLGDENRLFQIVLNLVNNAIKFTAEGFIKTEFCTATPDYWLIRVQDSGYGIAQNDQALIFEPFQQIVGTGQEGEGLGLGLSIVKQFVALMNGEITLNSQVDKGTTIEIRLPIHVEEI